MAVQERLYGITFDYVVVFDDYPDEKFDSSLLGVKKWISVKVRKSLDQNRFNELLANYCEHVDYTDKRYILYFNQDAHIKLPRVQPSSGVHEHVNIKLSVMGQLLKIKPRYAKNWYNVSGSVELGEEPENAAKREIHEELGFHVGDMKFIKTKKMFIKIPIVDKPIETMMYYYDVQLNELPNLVIDKKEIGQVKLGNLLISAKSSDGVLNI
jgi:NUDIX domain